MNVNRKIIVATVFITGTAILRTHMTGQPMTPILIGGYVFMLVLSILDMFGGDLSKIAGALAMVAVVSMLFLFPWQQITTLLRGGATS
jgi:hypothetical protein